jgi:hypothetical protein
MKIALHVPDQEMITIINVTHVKIISISIAIKLKEMVFPVLVMIIA